MFRDYKYISICSVCSVSKICKCLVRPKRNSCIHCIGYCCLHRLNVRTKRMWKMKLEPIYFRFRPFRYLFIYSRRLYTIWKNRIFKIFALKMVWSCGMACGNSRHHKALHVLQRLLNRKPDSCLIVYLVPGNRSMHTVRTVSFTETNLRKKTSSMIFFFILDSPKSLAIYEPSRHEEEASSTSFVYHSLKLFYLSNIFISYVHRLCGFHLRKIVHSPKQFQKKHPASRKSVLSFFVFHTAHRSLHFIP